MDQILTAENVKLTISILSFIFGIWQYLQKRRIKKLIALEAAGLHHNVATALGATDAAINAINRGEKGVSEIGRAQGLCQAVLFESGKLYCNLKNTKLDDIDELIANNQLAENYKTIYYSFSDKRRGYIGRFIKRIANLF